MEIELKARGSCVSRRSVLSVQVHTALCNAKFDRSHVSGPPARPPIQYRNISQQRPLKKLNQRAIYIADEGPAPIDTVWNFFLYM